MKKLKTKAEDNQSSERLRTLAKSIESTQRSIQAARLKLRDLETQYRTGVREDTLQRWADDPNLSLSDLASRYAKSPNRRLETVKIYEALQAELSNCNQLETALKQSEQELSSVVDVIGLQRSAELLKSRDETIKEVAKILLPYCSSEESATELASATDRAQSLHLRAMDWRRSATVAGKAVNLADELDREI